MICCVSSFGLLWFRINPGVHWCSSLWRQKKCSGHVRHNEWLAAATTDTSNLHGRVVDVDAKLLESGPSPAPGSFRGVEQFAWRVSPRVFAKIVRSLD